MLHLFLLSLIFFTFGVAPLSPLFLAVLHISFSLFQGNKVEPGLMRCCHIPCQSRPIDHPVHISNKLLLDIRRHIKKYYSVSTSAC